MGAIASASHASKEKFLPSFVPMMHKVELFLLLQGEGEEI